MPNLNQFHDFTYVVGIDIAKSVFQVHSCNTQTGEFSLRFLRAIMSSACF